MSWQPTCSPENWKKRQQLMQKVRAFFMARAVLEVETPVLSGACGTDPHLDYFETSLFVDVPGCRENALPRYLMTSPEFHMKRLLAAGFGDCFQIARAFRNGENGSRHNCEFSMVEWYRVGWTLPQLLEEVEALVFAILGRPVRAQRTPWREAFRIYAGVDAMRAERSDWEACCVRHGLALPAHAASWNRSDWWDYVMVGVIEPALGRHGAEFLTDYPASQAALAELWTDEQGNRWAHRFELYVEGVELCNGYQELTAGHEQAQRFADDLQLRERMEKRQPKIDQNFLAALDAGLPSCSGVALGLDRLFMLALGKTEIAEVILFPDANA